MEIWKDIPGYEGLYQVSNYGNVKSLNYRGTKGKHKCLKQNTDKYGYKVVILANHGKYKSYKVHRLVASAFIENPNNYPQVNHLDENPANNNYLNLEWCTAKYNINYGTRNKRAGEAQMGEKNHRYGKPAWNKGLKGAIE